MNAPDPKYDRYSRQMRLPWVGKAGQDRDVLTLYGSVWTRCDKPRFDAPEFMMQSNWFRVGSDYAALLKKAGRAKDAADIEARLGIKP